VALLPRRIRSIRKWPAEGQKIYARDCAACHDPRAEFTNKVVPITEVGTDPERMYSWSKDAAAEANRRVKQLGIDRPPMVETQDPYGYVSPPLDGIWLRAPYLHNGSVPTLRDLLNSPSERPQLFIAATMFSIRSKLDSKSRRHDQPGQPAS